MNSKVSYGQLYTKVREALQSLNLTSEEISHVQAEGLERLIPKVIQLISSETTGSLLDVGCGDGTTAYCLKRILNLEVTGIDCDSIFLKRAENKGIKTVSLNLETDIFPFPDETFSHVTFIEVIEHLAKPEHCLSEIARVLKPEGELILTTPNLVGLGNRISILSGKDPISGELHIRPYERHIRLYARNSLESLLANWFRVIKLDWCRPYRPQGRYSWKVLGRDILCTFKKDLSGQILVKCQRLNLYPNKD